MGIITGVEDRRETGTKCKANDTRTVRASQRVCHDVEGICFAMERREGRRDIRRSPDFEGGNFNAECESARAGFKKNWRARTKILDLAVSISRSNLFRIQSGT